MNYTKKSSTCKQNLQTFKNLLYFTAEKEAPLFVEKEAPQENVKKEEKIAPLVNTEVCCRKVEKSPKSWESELPNYVKKFVRKHTAVYCFTTDGTKLNEDKTLRKFSTRLVCCNSKINDFMEPKSIDIKEQTYENGKSRHINGTIKCGSPWICPSCSATLSMTRGEQLKHIVECGREHNRAYGMAVLTIRHKPGQTLKYLQDALTNIFRIARTRTAFRNFLKKENIRFIHRGYEIMASIKNNKSDWHPHFNLIFDYDKMQEMNEEEKIRYEFKTAKFLWSIFNDISSKKYGIQLKEPFLEEVTKQYQGKEEIFYKTHLQVKGGVSFNLDFEEEYTTKFGLVEEATAGMYKSGNGSFHPFQILDMIRKEDETMTKKEKILLIQMFREYALATKGKSFFRFGRGSVKYYQDNYNLELNVLEDEEEILAREAQGDIFYSVELKLWKLFNPNCLNIATLLMQDTAQDMENYILQIVNERLRE